MASGLRYKISAAVGIPFIFENLSLLEEKARYLKHAFFKPNLTEIFIKVKLVQKSTPWFSHFFEMLKRRLGWEARQELEAGLDISDATSASSSSENESDSEMSSMEDAGDAVQIESTASEEKLKRTKVMILSGRGVNARYSRLIFKLIYILDNAI